MNRVFKVADVRYNPKISQNVIVVYHALKGMALNLLGIQKYETN